jgi:hypothetical protein
MSWEALGAIGELVGAVAVIVTLFYLARQIKDGATQMKVGALTELNNIYKDAFLPIYNSRENMTIWVKGLASPESVADVDLEIFFLFMMRLMAPFETIVVQHGESAIEEQYFERYRNTMKGIIQTPGGRAWLATGQMELSADAKSYLEVEQSIRP